MGMLIDGEWSTKWYDTKSHGGCLLYTSDAADE